MRFEDEVPPPRWLMVPAGLEVELTPAGPGRRVRCGDPSSPGRSSAGHRQPDGERPGQHRESCCHCGAVRPAA
ncbi:hypothetical protein OG920_45805 [Streptomyces europaeiscabiei]|uniref:hypothetical protein n=1 Tax=Streptomyces TaxID=1883 RepID=UPI000A3BF8F9|nr:MULTISPECIES: hypothetical protein [Streptomyces]MDX3588698.1 hypothetical protein [Streptomyces europaeiscabiei]MDX3618771.1 hypothetical protein [Streptomyces europaeiscabiei]MDX3637606.1 hypothetical protein [Streptomyces europaeiscabiei]MDX3652921.1 hypothetical protein [Streptomyces europaeiscabiei]WUD30027.1 hypothetical protein OG858_00405 [Streptomyces europaeiscabiei]